MFSGSELPPEISKMTLDLTSAKLDKRENLALRYQ